MSRTVGALSGEFEMAEGWRRHLHLGSSAVEQDPLADALEGATEMKRSELINTLMGKKAELRFRFIQENAAFVEELDI